MVAHAHISTIVFYYKGNALQMADMGAEIHSQVPPSRSYPVPLPSLPSRSRPRATYVVNKVDTRRLVVVDTLRPLAAMIVEVAVLDVVCLRVGLLHTRAQ